MVLDEHPLDTYFRELRDRRRRELARRKLAALKATQVRVGVRRDVRVGWRLWLGTRAPPFPHLTG